MDGIKYLGFKKYTKSDILALVRPHVTCMNKWQFRAIDPILEGPIRPTDPFPEIINFALPYTPTPSIGNIIKCDDKLNHLRLVNSIKQIKTYSDEFYNDICIPEVIRYLKTEYLKTE